MINLLTVVKVIQAPLTQRQMQKPDSSVDSMELDDTRRNDQGSDEEIDVVGNQDPLADIGIVYAINLLIIQFA